MANAAADAQVLGVSVDSQFSHLAWIQTGKIWPGS
jgi:alkyl hydroperoxide reductase subunit AhpC